MAKTQENYEEVIVMARKLFSSTFGALAYDSGIMPAGSPAAPLGGETVTYLPTAQAYGVSNHDDRLYLDGTGAVSLQAHTFMSYDFHDLRDLLEEGECLADAMIGIQRMKETPDILACYNVAPGRNIRETIIVTNADVDCDNGRLNPPLGLTQVFKAGFHPLVGLGQNIGKMASQRELLYCERRVYAQDQSQTYSSPNQMGSMTGTPPTVTPTRWLNNWLMIDRTVTGEADLVIGPTLMVLRLIEVLCGDRDSQTITTNPGDEAQEYLNNDSRVYLTFTPFTLNVVGNKRKLTETEKAIEYSNVFLSNQNDVKPV
jgi:hypothetical protein